MPHWNEIIRNGRKKVILVNHRSRKRTILFARRPSSKRWFKSLEENWGGNSSHNDFGPLRQNSGPATVSRVVPQSLSPTICGSETVKSPRDLQLLLNLRDHLASFPTVSPRRCSN